MNPVIKTMKISKPNTSVPGVALAFALLHVCSGAAIGADPLLSNTSPVEITPPAPAPGECSRVATYCHKMTSGDQEEAGHGLTSWRGSGLQEAGEEHQSLEHSISSAASGLHPALSAGTNSNRLQHARRCLQARRWPRARLSGHEQDPEAGSTW